MNINNSHTYVPYTYPRPSKTVETIEYDASGRVVKRTVTTEQPSTPRYFPQWTYNHAPLQVTC